MRKESERMSERQRSLSGVCGYIFHFLFRSSALSSPRATSAASQQRNFGEKQSAAQSNVTQFSATSSKALALFIILNFSMRISSDASRASSPCRRCFFSHFSRRMPEKSARNRRVDCISESKGALRSSGTLPCAHSASLTNCRALACTIASQVLSNGRKLYQTVASTTDYSARCLCLLGAEKSCDFIVESDLHICIGMPRCSSGNL